VAAPRNRKHILVPGPPTAEEYKPHGRKIDVTRPAPPASRAKHGKALERALEAAVVEAKRRREEAGIEVHGAVPGLYVQFESRPDVPLQVASLEDSRQGIEVVAVSHSKTMEPEPRRIERATVFVPDEISLPSGPPVVRAPNGVIKDIGEIWAKGRSTYDPAQIRVPTMLVIGEWDQDTPLYMAQDVFAKMSNSPDKRFVILGEGTHAMALEKHRMRLIREVQQFLEE